MPYSAFNSFNVCHSNETSIIMVMAGMLGQEAMTSTKRWLPQVFNSYFPIKLNWQAHVFSTEMVSLYRKTFSYTVMHTLFNLWKSKSQLFSAWILQSILPCPLSVFWLLLHQRDSQTVYMKYFNLLQWEMSVISNTAICQHCWLTIVQALNRIESINIPLPPVC